MRERLIILVGIVVVVAVLIALNAASFSQQERLPDSELLPNRSTLNTGVTGTRAYFDLLLETGRNPVRWTETPADLASNDAIKAFVVIGPVREAYTDREINVLLKWVEAGHRLVIIDRQPPKELIKTTSLYELKIYASEFPYVGTDAHSQSEMTIGTNAATPSIPSVLTAGINAIQPSRFASTITFARFDGPLGEVSSATEEPTSSPFASRDEDEWPEEPSEEATPTPSREGRESRPRSESKPRPLYDEIENADSPVVHFANDQKNFVVDVPFGNGRIVFISDPYIVSNAGIRVADNASFAINAVNVKGAVAFDEYHNGYGSNRNRFFEFFAGTPIISMFLQVFLIIGLLFFSQSRRFARPVPEPEPNRLSKLEYVSAMAELQQRTRGYDLAIENIYTDFRRRVARLIGVDARTTPRSTIAMLIIERLPDESADAIESMMRRCEDIIHGDVARKKEVVEITSHLRKIERRLGLARRKDKDGAR